MGWMNLASILLGLAGWGLPVWGLKRWMRGRRKELGLCCWGSGLCCGGALWFQLGYSAHLAEIGDWPAWMDADAVSAVSGFLLVTTALVNGAAVLLSRQEDD